MGSISPSFPSTSPFPSDIFYAQIDQRIIELARKNWSWSQITPQINEEFATLFTTDLLRKRCNKKGISIRREQAHFLRRAKTVWKAIQKSTKPKTKTERLNALLFHLDAEDPVCDLRRKSLERWTRKWDSKKDVTISPPPALDPSLLAPQDLPPLFSETLGQPLDIVNPPP
jgi:hypothetical protein